MAFDGVLINSIVNELKIRLENGRIDKIHQPSKDSLHISVWCKSATHKVLITCNPTSPRIHLTKEEKVNPKSPPMFCMLLRKHLLSGRILNIVQPSFDRIVELHVESLNEFGDVTVKKLVLECMGKYSNIILVDDNQRIVDSIKHVTSNMSRVREIFPGKKYEYPLLQGKINPLSDATIVSDFFDNNEDSIQKPDAFISSSFSGISKTTAQEIAFRFQSKKFRCLKDAFSDFFIPVLNNDFAPTLLIDETTNEPVDVIPFDYQQFDQYAKKYYSSPSELVEFYYSEKERLFRISQNISTIDRVLRSNLEKSYKKLALQNDEISTANKSENFRLFGELITSNLHQNLSNVDHVNLLDYYQDPPQYIEIPVDKNKTMSQNAQDYYKKFTKSKNAIRVLTSQIESTKTEIEYLESQLHNLENSVGEDELEEIRHELVNEHYLRDNTKKVKKESLPSQPHYFQSLEGFEILVGKNNTQNDTLTLKTAGVHDIWLHTKNIPGSHVIIKSKGKDVPHNTILEAAMLAAYFSKARNSSNVPIDYCPRKNVKKPRGSKPGMVTYEKYRTLNITIVENVIKRIFETTGKMRNQF